MTHSNIPAAYWSENKESIEKLENWGEKNKIIKRKNLNVNILFNLISLYTLHASPALETTQKSNKYNISPFPFCLFLFPKDHECFKQERFFSHLHRTKHAKLDWIFKMTFTYVKFTIPKQNSDHTLQMAYIRTQLLVEN